MKTIWGERIDPENILPDYPRPQMRRARAAVSIATPTWLGCLRYWRR